MIKKENEQESLFKVNKQDKDMFRERIARKLYDIDFNSDKRIKLPKDKLETLLFDYDEKLKCKKFGYFYDGLCKLDLSEISLEGVDLESEELVDLSSSNINIDFTKIFKLKNELCSYIKNINFSNIDLSGASFNQLNSYVFDNCNLSNTNFDFPEIEMEFNNCDFRNNDFDGLNLFCDGSGDLIYDDYVFTYCNFSNTGVEVQIANYSKNEDFNLRKAKEQIGDLVKLHYLDGCIVCGSFIKTEEQKEKEAKELRKKYDKFVSAYINETIDMIDKQLSSEGGKMSKTLKNVPNNREEI